MTNTPFRTVLVAVLATFAVSSLSGKPENQAPDASKDPAKGLTLDALFPSDRVLDVQITIDDDNWDDLRYQSRTIFSGLAASRKNGPPKRIYTYFEADVTIDGVKFPKVGLRKKGFVGSQSTTRPSLKVKLTFSDPEGGIEGLKRLTFNNNKQDVAVVQQFLGYRLFNEAGAPAPRCAFAHVTVNGKSLGIYSHVESVKKPLLKRGFGDAGGVLYEGTVVDFVEGWEKAFELKRGNDEIGRARILEFIEFLGGAKGQRVLSDENPVRAFVPTDDSLGLKWTEFEFDDSSWKTGKGGIGYEKSQGYEEHFKDGVDLVEEMHGTTGSAYARYAFDVEDPKAVTKLNLRMKYDDGFVAYLNGQKIVSRNAPEEPQWNSEATSQHFDQSAVRYQSFPVSKHLEKLRQGKNVLAIHGLNGGVSSSDFLISPEILLVQSESTAKLEDFVDVDGFYRYWAVEGLLGFWDGYSANRNNYFAYMHPETKKFHFIPWGADSMFAKYSMIDWNKSKPISVKLEGIVANRLYRREGGSERYLKTLREIMKKHWVEEKWIEEIDRLEKLLAPYAAKNVEQKRFAERLEKIREFVRTRRGDIEEETREGMPAWDRDPADIFVIGRAPRRP